MPQSAALSHNRDLTTGRMFEPFALMTTTSAAPWGPVPGVRAVAIIEPFGENDDER